MPKAKKSDNGHLAAKLELRRHFLAKFPPPGPKKRSRFKVFDACQGEGVLWSVLRREFPCDYWGVDVKPKKGRLKIDSVKVLGQPGWDFDVVDIDTYGSPWKHYQAMMPYVRRPVTVFLTLGFVRAGGGGNVGNAFMRAAGLEFAHLPIPSALAGSVWDVCMVRCLGSCYAEGVRATYAAEAVVEGGTARYVGVRLVPDGRKGPHNVQEGPQTGGKRQSGPRNPGEK